MRRKVNVMNEYVEQEQCALAQSTPPHEGEMSAARVREDRGALSLKTLLIVLLAVLSVVAVVLSYHFGIRGVSAFAAGAADPNNTSTNAAANIAAANDATTSDVAVPVLSLSAGGWASDGEASELEASLIVLEEDGASRYSTDNGQTWTEGYPEGFSLSSDEQGTVSIAGDGLPIASIDGSLTVSSAAEGGTLGVRLQGDTVGYSTDGGVTWSNEVPEGVETEVK
jgi:hypothetical protein